VDYNACKRKSSLARILRLLLTARCTTGCPELQRLVLVLRQRPRQLPLTLLARLLLGSVLLVLSILRRRVPGARRHALPSLRVVSSCRVQTIVTWHTLTWVSLVQ
jgi:hypothetical protein